MRGIHRKDYWQSTSDKMESPGVFEFLHCCIVPALDRVLTGSYENLLLDLQIVANPVIQGSIYAASIP